MKCEISNNQIFHCPNGKLEQISSFKGLEFRDFFIRNGFYFAYSRTFEKQRSLSQLQISDNPVPRFVDGKWIRGNISVDKSTDYGCPMKPFFSEMPNFWASAENLGR